MKNLIKITFIFSLLFSCDTAEEMSIPKPKGSLRIQTPDHNYESYVDSCGFSFKKSTLAEVVVKPSKDSSGCFRDINYNSFKATLYLTKLKMDTLLDLYISNSRDLVYEHIVKASAIDEESFYYTQNNISGLKYHIKGNAASPYQFYCTDSSKNFIRGSLYFNVKPNYDSILPYLNYIKTDMDTLLSTLKLQ